MEWQELQKEAMPPPPQLHTADTPGGPYLAYLMLEIAEHHLLLLQRVRYAEKLARNAYVQLCYRAPLQRKLVPARPQRSQPWLHVQKSLQER